MKAVYAIFFFISVSVFSQNFKHEKYIKKYSQYARIEMERGKIPASITLAQGILESGNGKSELSVDGFNHFGIKCKTHYEGKVMFLDDDAKDDCFRVYESVLDSYKDHSDFLHQNQRYSDLFKLDIMDYKGWARGLKKAGYATNPKYANLLIDIIEDNQLYLLDESFSEWNLAYENFVNKKITPVNETKVEEIVEATEVIKVQDKHKVLNKYQRVYTNRNGSVYVLARNGDTFESLKNRHDVWISELKRYNELAISTTYKGDEKVYIRPKKNKGADKHYLVKEGDSLYSIAQEFGVKQKKILRKNKLRSAHQIMPGMRLRMR